MFTTDAFHKVTFSNHFINIYITQKNVNVKQKIKKEIKFFRSNLLKTNH